MNKKPERQITLNELARMVANQFGIMQAQISGVENSLGNRLGSVESRLDTVENHLERIDRKLNHAIYESQFDRLTGRVVVLEKKAGI